MSDYEYGSPTPSQQAAEEAEVNEEHPMECEEQGFPEAEPDEEEQASLFGRSEPDDDDLEYDDDSASTPQNNFNGGYANFQQTAARGRGDSGSPGRNAPDVPVRVDASVMADYDARHLGQDITPRAPYFPQGTCQNGTWISYQHCGEDIKSFRPVRAEAIIVPAKIVSPDATRFRHWTTPTEGTERAACIAALLSLMFTPTSKGFMSGNHEEVQRANGEAEEDGEGDENQSKVKRVYRYSYVHPEDNSVSVPMFIIGYQELYNRAHTEVTAIKVWKFVLDPAHSDSELQRKLMEENQSTGASAGMAHYQNVQRRKNLVSEQKQMRAVSGGMAGKKNLEYFAATQYVHIKTEQQLHHFYEMYSGKDSYSPGKPLFDNTQLPHGVYNRTLYKNTALGGTHPLGPEYVWCQRRQMAFEAGTIDLDGSELDIDPDQLNCSNYWQQDGTFCISHVDDSLECFFFCMDPSVTNIFDCVLPRSIVGAVTAGKDLIKLFEEEMVGEEEKLTPAQLSDRFNALMTRRDATHVRMENQMMESVVTYDSVDISDMERKDLRFYGEKESKDCFVVEHRQILKDIQSETRSIVSTLIEPWLQKQGENSRALHRKVTECFRAGEAPDYYDPEMEEVRKLDQETQGRHNSVIKDLICLHVSRIQRCFESKVDRESIPQGYIAMYDGLNRELAKTENNTASVAFAYNSQLLYSDMTAYAQMSLFIGQFFETDCFIEGRDWRLMQEIFLHFFEQYGAITLLLLFCGCKGNGKSLRAERAKAVFPEGWSVDSGMSSARAGMNGGNSTMNGCNVLYDEMIGDLCDSEGSDRLEFWK